MGNKMKDALSQRGYNVQSVRTATESLKAYERYLVTDSPLRKSVKIKLDTLTGTLATMMKGERKFSEIEPMIAELQSAMSEHKPVQLDKLRDEPLAKRILVDSVLNHRMLYTDTVENGKFSFANASPGKYLVWAVPKGNGSEGWFIPVQIASTDPTVNLTNENLSSLIATTETLKEQTEASLELTLQMPVLDEWVGEESAGLSVIQKTLPLRTDIGNYLHSAKTFEAKPFAENVGRFHDALPTNFSAPEFNSDEYKTLKSVLDLLRKTSTAASNAVQDYQGAIQFSDILMKAEAARDLDTGIRASSRAKEFMDSVAVNNTDCEQNMNDALTIVHDSFLQFPFDSVKNSTVMMTLSLDKQIAELNRILSHSQAPQQPQRSATEQSIDKAVRTMRQPPASSPKKKK